MFHLKKATTESWLTEILFALQKDPSLHKRSCLNSIKWQPFKKKTQNQKKKNLRKTKSEHLQRLMGLSGHACGRGKFLGQGWNPCHRNDPSHSSDNAGSLICWATRELQQELYFWYPYIYSFIICNISCDITSHIAKIVFSLFFFSFFSDHSG